MQGQIISNAPESEHSLVIVNQTKERVQTRVRTRNAVISDS